MTNKTYQIGQEFSITNKTANQSIYKIKIVDTKMFGEMTEYKITFYQKDEMNDGSFKKSQSSSWYMDMKGIKEMMMAGNLIEKN